MSRDTPFNISKFEIARLFAASLAAHGVTDIFWGVDYTLTFNSLTDTVREISTNTDDTSALTNSFQRHGVEKILCDKNFLKILLPKIQENGIKNHVASQSFSEHINALFSAADIAKFFTSIAGHNELNELGLRAGFLGKAPKFLKIWNVINAVEEHTRPLMIDNDADEILATKSFFDSLFAIRDNLFGGNGTNFIKTTLDDSFKISPDHYKENSVISKDGLSLCIRALLKNELIKVSKEFYPEQEILLENLSKTIENNGLLRTKIIQRLLKILSRVFLVNNEEINRFLGSLSPEKSIHEKSKNIGLTAARAEGLGQIMMRQPRPVLSRARAVTGEAAASEAATHYQNPSASRPTSSINPTANLSGAASEATAYDDANDDSDDGYAELDEVKFTKKINDILTSEIDTDLGINKEDIKKGPEFFEEKLCETLNDYCQSCLTAIYRLNNARLGSLLQGIRHTQEKNAITNNFAKLHKLLEFIIRTLPALDEALEMGSRKIREGLKKTCIVITDIPMFQPKDFHFYIGALRVIESFSKITSEVDALMTSRITTWINSIDTQHRSLRETREIPEEVPLLIDAIRQNLLRQPHPHETRGRASSDATPAAIGTYRRSAPSFLETLFARSAPAALGERRASTAATPARQEAAIASRRSSAVSLEAAASRTQASFEEPAASRAPLPHENHGENESELRNPEIKNPAPSPSPQNLEALSPHNINKSI